MKQTRSVTIVRPGPLTPNEVTTTDYTPYGKIRNDVQVGTSGFKEQKKFTGYEFDASSDLSYAQNRYYNQNIGQFTTPDPVAQAVGVSSLTQRLLLDPQQQNGFTYSRNNPLRFKDTDGLKVEAVAKEIEAQPLGTHVFIQITPDSPQDFNVKEGTIWTLGGYAGDKGNLIKMRNADSDYSAATTGYSAPQAKIGAVKARTEVQRPAGMTDSEFIRALQSQYDSYGEDAAYDPFSGNGYNSNNLATTWLLGAGVTALPWGGNAPGIDPGYGVALPSGYKKANGQIRMPSGSSQTTSVLGGYSSRKSSLNSSQQLQASSNSLQKSSNVSKDKVKNK